MKKFLFCIIFLFIFEIFKVVEVFSFSAKFPATRGIHTFIKAKVIYLEDSEKNSLSIVRIDTVGVDLNIYRKLKEKIDSVLKEDRKKHTLIISATHTHAGPGRLAQNPLWHLACDTYSPWLFKNILEQLFNIWVKAKEKTIPAKIGVGNVNNHYFSGDAPGLIEMKRVKTTENLKIKSVSLNLAISREILGYKDGEFPYPSGAALCGLGVEHCDNDYLILTLPGEPHTSFPPSPEVADELGKIVEDVEIKKESPKEETRRFKWEIVWRYKRSVPSSLKIEKGFYRFKITGKGLFNGKIQEYQIISSEIKL
jgi:hypothetical protein